MIRTLWTRQRPLVLPLSTCKSNERPPDRHTWRLFFLDDRPHSSFPEEWGFFCAFSAGLLCRNLGALLASFRKTDGNRLFAAGHLAAFAALAGPKRTSLLP